MTLKGGHARRPDLVRYVNGIAVAVVELKNSRVGMSEGIRQLLSNRKPEVSADFFRTVHSFLPATTARG